MFKGKRGSERGAAACERPEALGKASCGLHAFRMRLLRVALVACALVATCALVGCAGGASGNSQGTISVTDSIGRTVEVPANAENVAALDSFSAECMVMVGAGEQLCGSPAGVLSDVVLCEVYPDLPSVSVPMSGGTVNIETLAASNPDVVLVKESLYTTEGETEKLEKMGIPYVVVSYTNMEEQIEAIELIGAVCGGDAQAKASELSDYYRNTIERVRGIAAGIPEAERVRVYHAINEIVRTDGAESLGADWVSAVGAVNVSAAEAGTSSEGDYTASLEQIYVWDPDVVVCNSAGTVNYLLSDSKWQGLRAVKEGAVEAIPVGATRWGQRGSVETFFAMLWLGTTVYPDYYASVDLQGEVTAFYRDFLGVEVTDEEYVLMLTGTEMRAAATTSAAGAK